MEFRTIYGHNEFLVRSFLLTNDSTIFIDFMKKVFRSYLDSFFIVIIYDIFVYSKNKCEHMNHLWVVLQVHNKNQIFSKYSKCEYLLRWVAFLDHIISNEGDEVYLIKTQAVKSWPNLLTQTDIRRFLGLKGYYRRFVYGFVSIACPLTSLTQKSVNFEWSEARDRSFQILNDKINSDPVFTLLKGTKGFILYCDASREGLLCLLTKHGKAIAYASRQLKVHEKNNPTRDLDFAAWYFP